MPVNNEDWDQTDPARVLNSGARWTLVALVVLAFIIGPFLAFGTPLEAWSEGVVESLSGRPFLVGAFITSLLAADVLLPVPSSVLSVAAGALLGPAGGLTASFLGMTVGCLVGYGLGRYGGRGAVERILGGDELGRLEAKARRNGFWTLVASRPVPVLAEASVVFAGLSAMAPLRFLVVVGLSNLGISLAYALIGAYAATTQSFLLAVAGAFALPGLAMLLFRPLRERGQLEGPPALATVPKP